MNPLMRRAVLTFSKRNRARKAAWVARFMAEHDVRTAIFVGCSPGTNSNEGIVERAVAQRADVLAACDVLTSIVPWPFVLGDGRAMPFSTGGADMVLANAVIEHVGSLEDQRRFVAEQTRVGRTWVITTPNRWFPIESHTSVLFRHWSTSWRSGRGEFTRLLSRREFSDLLPPGARIHGRPWSATFTATYSA
jgi:hypothetical protein